MNQVNEKIIVRVLPAEGSNSEFAPDKDLQQGIECDGYVLLLFRENKLFRSGIRHLSVSNIADEICDECNEGNVPALRQAFTLAEALIRMDEIDKQARSRKALRRIAKVLHGIDPDEEFPDELPQEFPEDEIQEFPDEDCD